MKIYSCLYIIGNGYVWVLGINNLGKNNLPIGKDDPTAYVMSEEKESHCRGRAS